MDFEGAGAFGLYFLRYFDAPFFYPYEQSLSLIDLTFGLAMLAAPVNWATGNMFLGYNVTWLLTFVLSGLGAYLLTRQLTRSVPAALLAGSRHLPSSNLRSLPPRNPPQQPPPNATCALEAGGACQPITQTRHS